MAVEKRSPEAYKTIAGKVRNSCFNFPKVDLGEFITKLKQKVEKPYLLDNKGAVKLEKISSLEEYLAQLFNSYPGNFWISSQLINSVIEAAEYWIKHSKKYSMEEIILIELAQLAVSHCVVLRIKDFDIKPEQKLKYITTIISTGRFVTEKVNYRVY